MWRSAWGCSVGAESRLGVSWQQQITRRHALFRIGEPVHFGWFINTIHLRFPQFNKNNMDNKRLNSRVGSGHPNSSDDRNEAANKDSTAAPEVLVQWRVRPAPDKGGAGIRRAVEEALH